MKIINITTETVSYESRMVADSDGHAHPGDLHKATTVILKILCDNGLEGFSFGQGISPEIVKEVIKPAILGEDPFYREKIWQTLRTWQRLKRPFTDQNLCAVDIALWDICGKSAGLPVYKMLGAFRDKVPAYGSIMVGDDFDGGLNTPQAYGDFALKLIDRGYTAIKLHTWMPPIIPEPDPKMDILACSAVREAVGPDVKLMLDPYHDYSRQQAYYLGRELEKLDFYWLEEPMNEHSMSSYQWLTDNLDLTIVGPETAEGKNYVRAEWIASGASDVSRAGDEDMGGITPLIKTVHLCESFNMSVELHGNTLGNLHILAAMGIPGEFYERGLLHPFLDYEEPKPWFKSLTDPMDPDGFVHLPVATGMGWDIDFDYIAGNTVI